MTTKVPQQRYTDKNPGQLKPGYAGNSPTLNESSIRGRSCRSSRFDSDDSYASSRGGSFSNDATFASDESSYGNGRNPSTSSRFRPAGDSPTLNESSIRGSSFRSGRFDSDDSYASSRGGSFSNDATFASDESSYGNGRNPSTSSRFRPAGDSPTLNESSIRSDSRRSDSSYAGPNRSTKNDSTAFVTAIDESRRSATFDDSSYGNGRNPSTSSRFRPAGDSPTLNESSIRGYGGSTSSRQSTPGYSSTPDVSPVQKTPYEDDVFLPSSKAGKVPPRKRLDFSSAARMDFSSESDSKFATTGRMDFSSESDSKFAKTGRMDFSPESDAQFTTTGRMDFSSESSPGYSPKNGNQQTPKFNFSVDELPKDEYVDSQKVANLNKTNFYDLLGSKDITLVFFYDPRKPESAAYKDSIKQASGCTKRSNHAYAAVNCKTSGDLCKEVGAQAAPMLKIYRGLKNIGDIYRSKTTADEIRRTVEQG